MDFQLAQDVFLIVLKAASNLLQVDKNIKHNLNCLSLKKSLLFQLSGVKGNAHSPKVTF